MTADSGGHGADKLNENIESGRGGHVVNKNKARGKAEQVKGKVEQAVGKAVGSEETQARGERDQAEGESRESMADLKTNVNKVIDKVKADLN